MHRSFPFGLAEARPQRVPHRRCHPVLDELLEAVLADPVRQRLVGLPAAGTLGLVVHPRSSADERERSAHMGMRDSECERDPPAHRVTDNVAWPVDGGCQPANRLRHGLDAVVRQLRRGRAAAVTGEIHRDAPPAVQPVDERCHRRAAAGEAVDDDDWLAVPAHLGGEPQRRISAVHRKSGFPAARAISTASAIRRCWLRFASASTSMVMTRRPPPG